MVTPVFEADRLTYRYPDGRIGLREVSLSIAQGESVVILGANASGKSTLLHLLAGLAFPTGTPLRAFGTELTESTLERGSFAQNFRQRVGLLFQDIEAMLFNPTVWDEVAFGPLQLDLPREEVERRVQETLDLLGLRPIAEQPPHALSGGERKKVALGAMLAVSPEVLLLDEPTSGLDPISTGMVEESLHELKKEYTIVIVPHSVQQASRVADYAAFFLMGELIEQQAGTRVFTQPREQRTEDYVTGRFG